MTQNSDDEWIMKANTQASSHNRIYTANGDELKVWQKAKSGTFTLLCTIRHKHALSDETDQSSSKIVQFQPDFKYEPEKMGLCIVYQDRITIWDEANYTLVKEFELADSDFLVKDACFDAKGRRILLKNESGIRVVSTMLNTELWRLNFESISHIQSSDANNSHFIATMNSEDNPSGPLDSLIVFNYKSAKPVKVIKLNAKDPIVNAGYVYLSNLDYPSISLITKKGMIQYIHFINKGCKSSRTRLELIKKENSLSGSGKNVPQVDYMHLDDEVEEFELDQSMF